MHLGCVGQDSTPLVELPPELNTSLEAQVEEELAKLEGSTPEDLLQAFPWSI